MSRTPKLRRKGWAGYLCAFLVRSACLLDSCWTKLTAAGDNVLGGSGECSCVPERAELQGGEWGCQHDGHPAQGVTHEKKECSRRSEMDGMASGAAAWKMESKMSRMSEAVPLKQAAN